MRRRWSAAPVEEDLDDAAFAHILGGWLALTYALNAVNRSMGRADLYPFTLAPRKLQFVHERVREASAAPAVR